MHALNANALLTASIQRLADTVHMTAQLVMAGDEKASWARSFDGSRADLLRLQQRIALSAAHSLGVVSGKDPAAIPARDPAALDLYIRGRYAWNQRGRDPLLRSIDLFRQALDIDPTFALAYSGMGDAYVQLGYGSFLRPDDAFLKARAAAERALDLDSTLAEPHATLAFVAMYYDWDWDRARQEFERALARNPSYATAHEWLGLFEAAMGGFDDANTHERRAQQLDPLSVPIAGTVGWVLYYSGRLDDAARELQIALRQNSAFPLGHLYLGRVFEARGQLDSALAQYAATGALKEWVPTIAARAYVFGRQQNQKQARAELAHMDSLAHAQYVTAYAVALVHAALAQPDSAFASLDRAVAERTHWLVWLNRDPRWHRCALTRALRSWFSAWDCHADLTRPKGQRA
jgi:tetratricopeptide (TPR) repeat protein